MRMLSMGCKPVELFGRASTSDLQQYTLHCSISRMAGVNSVAVIVGKRTVTQLSINGAGWVMDVIKWVRMVARKSCWYDVFHCRMNATLCCSILL